MNLLDVQTLAPGTYTFNVSCNEDDDGMLFSDIRVAAIELAHDYARDAPRSAGRFVLGCLRSAHGYRLRRIVRLSVSSGSQVSESHVPRNDFQSVSTSWRPR